MADEISPVCVSICQLTTIGYGDEELIMRRLVSHKRKRCAH
jgi:hypothetical protein